MEKIMDESGAVVAEIELIYKPQIKLSAQPKIVTSEDAYKIFLQGWDKNKIQFIEQLKVMLLTRANSVIGIINISSGNAGGTIADPKIIIASAIKANASRIVLAHNHPSGFTKPSKADLDLTTKLKGACLYFDLLLLDHLIITNERFLSMGDEGIL